MSAKHIRKTLKKSKFKILILIVLHEVILQYYVLKITKPQTYKQTNFQNEIFCENNVVLTTAVEILLRAAVAEQHLYSYWGQRMA